MNLKITLRLKAGDDVAHLEYFLNAKSTIEGWNWGDQQAMNLLESLFPFSVGVMSVENSGEPTKYSYEDSVVGPALLDIMDQDENGDSYEESEV